MMQAALPRMLVLCMLVFSCSIQESNVLQLAEKKNRSDAGSVGASVGIGKLTLVWEQAVGTADTFDIYFVADSKNLKGSAKMTSMPAGKEARQSYTLTAKQIQAAEVAAVVGNQKCFYVVALSAGAASDPSEPDCLVLAEQ